jgi:hypothetical protein
MQDGSENPSSHYPEMSTATSASGFLTAIQQNFSRFWPLALGISVVFGIRQLFAVPKELKHIPAVPVIPTLWSFAKGEVEDVRIKRLLLPYANKGEGAVLVYALGRWIIHILDRKVRILLTLMSCHIIP